MRLIYAEYSLRGMRGISMTCGVSAFKVTLSLNWDLSNLLFRTISISMYIFMWSCLTICIFICLYARVKVCFIMYMCVCFLFYMYLPVCVYVYFLVYLCKKWICVCVYVSDCVYEFVFVYVYLIYMSV